VEFDAFTVFLVVAVSAPAQTVALLPCRKALAVELHALGVSAVAVLLLNRFLPSFSRIHYFIFKFKLYLDQYFINPPQKSHHHIRGTHKKQLKVFRQRGLFDLF
jgi:hypothetical protein